MDCYLAVVEGLACLCDPANSAGRGLVSGRCNQAGKINGKRPDKGQPKKKKQTKKQYLKRKVVNAQCYCNIFLQATVKLFIR